MEACGQPHNPATSSMRKEPTMPNVQEDGQAQGWSGCCVDKKFASAENETITLKFRDIMQIITNI
jgi:hypothetical protein